MRVYGTVHWNHTDSVPTGSSDAGLVGPTNARPLSGSVVVRFDPPMTSSPNAIDVLCAASKAGVFRLIVCLRMVPVAIAFTP